MKRNGQWLVPLFDDIISQSYNSRHGFKRFTTLFRISYNSNLLSKYENTFKGCVDMLEYIALEMLVVEHNIWCIKRSSSNLWICTLSRFTQENISAKSPQIFVAHNIISFDRIQTN